MLFMAVKAGMIFPLLETVASVTVITVLPGVSAWKLLHVLAWLRMTRNAAGRNIFQRCEICYDRGVRIVTSLAMGQGEMLHLFRVMTHAALGYYHLSRRRMGLVTVQTSYIIPVRGFMALYCPDNFIMTFYTVGIRQYGFCRPRSSNGGGENQHYKPYPGVIQKNFHPRHPFKL